jgi:hypothetical protein
MARGVRFGGHPDLGIAVGTRSGFAAYDDGPSGLESSRRFEPNQRETTRSRAGEVGARFGGHGPNQRGATPVSPWKVGVRFGGYGPTGEGPRSRAGKSVPASVGADQPARGRGLELESQCSLWVRANREKATRSRAGRSVSASVDAGQPARGHPVSSWKVGVRFGGCRPTGRRPPGLAQGTLVLAPVSAGQPATGHPVSSWKVGVRFGGCRPTGKGPPGLELESRCSLRRVRTEPARGHPVSRRGSRCPLRWVRTEPARGHPVSRRGGCPPRWVRGPVNCRGTQSGAFAYGSGLSRLEPGRRS